MQLDLDRALQVATRAAEAAGSLLREGARCDIAMCTKDTTGDVVTDLDLAAERVIIEEIRRAFPAHTIIAEESGLLDAADGDRVWLVDPLDGTNNLAIGLHAYVVGIALCESRLPLLGVVHDPIAAQTWSAIRGGGAWGPGLGAGVGPYVPAPWGPLMAWTQGHGVSRDDGTARALKLVLESRARRVLQVWAPLVSWVMLARGAIDGFVGFRAEAVDLPAGTLIAQEAGMAVCSLDGSAFNERIGGPEEDRSFVAGRPEIIDDLVRWVGEAEALKPDLERLLSESGAGPRLLPPGPRRPDPGRSG
jgi:myo-inositol-1(or 4)-monophosphatase